MPAGLTFNSLGHLSSMIKLGLEELESMKVTINAYLAERSSLSIQILAPRWLNRLSRR